MKTSKINQASNDIKSLISKCVYLLRGEDPALLESVTDLLSAARYVMKLHMTEEPIEPVRRIRAYDDDRDEKVKYNDDDFDPIDMTPERQRERSKRNLREDWAGPLPSRPRQKRVGVDVDSNGLSGPDPNNYDVTQADPHTKCPQCGIPISEHSVDRNADSDEHGFKPFIACDFTRVYCGMSK